MKLRGECLLRIYIAESAVFDGRPVYKRLVELFQKKKFHGCTVSRGMMGFGHENTIRTIDVVQLSLDLPVVIDVVDTEEKILEVLPEIEQWVEHGLVTLQNIRVLRKTGSD
ncbi:MAG: DUF190 domain-containing protein [Methanoregulaceae archaeon]